MIYAIFNREDHPRDGDVMQIGQAHSDEYGTPYFYMPLPGGSFEALYPHEFSDWFNLN